MDITPFSIYICVGNGCGGRQTLRRESPHIVSYCLILTSKVDWYTGINTFHWNYSLAFGEAPLLEQLGLLMSSFSVVKMLTYFLNPIA